MTSFPTSSWASRPLPVPCAQPPGPPAKSKRLARILSARPVRVAILLVAVWLLNGFDLLFTILANRLGCFTELNPVAASVLGDGNYAGIVLYKALLVGGGTYILWHFRRYRIAELSCWLVALLYAGLAFRWHRYYQVWNHYAWAGDAPFILPALQAP